MIKQYPRLYKNIKALHKNNPLYLVKQRKKQFDIPATLEQLLEMQRQRKGKNPLQETKPLQDAETQNNESNHQKMMENLDPLQFLQQKQQ
jgi:hypothetical protein